MKFVRVERVKYGKNPLIEVVCELKFPVQLAIQQSLPVEFQAVLGARYPFLEMAHEIQLEIQTPGGPGTPAGGGHMVRQGRITVYEFFSVDRHTKISLSDQSLRVSTSKYISWEVFEGQILEAFDALRRVYHVEYFSRLGLRYRDLIDRKILKCENLQWSELIKPEILSALRGYGLEDSEVEGFQQSFRVKLDTGSVAITHAMVRHNEGHDAFLIDADFSTEEVLKAEPTDVSNILRIFNVQAGGLFRSTISDTLHGLLEPTTIQ